MMDKILSYQDRIALLRETKMEQARIKRELFGGSDDLVITDRGLIPPTPDFNFIPEVNHPSGGFFGPKACGRNFRAYLDAHPVYIDPVSTLAGGFMGFFRSLREPHWNPEFDYTHLEVDHKKYGITHAIGGTQHLCPDIQIGLDLGWQGILDRIEYYRAVNGLRSRDFYDGLEDTVYGIQGFILRHADKAWEMALSETRPELRRNLEKMAVMNRRLVTAAPETFYEACQWIAWFVLVAVIYNASGAIGSLDDVLKPYYDRDKAAGILDDEEAIFHLACLLIKDDTYYQVGGVDPQGNDVTNEISFMMLEAEHRLKVPVHVTVRVHDRQNPELLKTAVRYLFTDMTGEPSFIGDAALNEGFVRNGFPVELARKRVKCGCHWMGIPGREYTLNDVLKINLAKVFEVAWDEMMASPDQPPGVPRLWQCFEKHLRQAVRVVAAGIDFQIEHMPEVFPELVLDLLCHGPVEKGIDISGGVLEMNNFGLDGAGIAVVADSFAALEQRIEKEGRLTWGEMKHYLDTNYQGAEDIRLMLRNIPRYGRGGTRADEYAVRIAQTFTRLVKEYPTPAGYNMIPGLFSWLSTIPMGKEVGATPNGRHAYAPISHGANPDPGLTSATSATQLATAVASVQCGYGNPAPLQMEVNPLSGITDTGIDKMTAFIRGLFQMGNTHLNITVLDKQKLLEAHRDPSRYPEMIVRVTGFCAYFANLSPEVRQLIIDRVVDESG